MARLTRCSASQLANCREDVMSNGANAVSVPAAACGLAWLMAAPQVDLAGRVNPGEQATRAGSGEDEVAGVERRRVYPGQHHVVGGPVELDHGIASPIVADVPAKRGEIAETKATADPDLVDA